MFMQAQEGQEEEENGEKQVTVERTDSSRNHSRERRKHSVVSAVSFLLINSQKGGKV